jgi:hypothetical protein
MPPQVRGPSESAPPPPDWLNSAALPITLIAAGEPLHRVHRTQHAPVFFGPGAAVPPTYRFDRASGRFGVLYVGTALSGALAETILRNPERRMVAMSEITTRSATKLSCDRDLRLVRMQGPGSQALGTDNAISTGPYEPCGLWANTLWDHPEKPDGIAYLSRHDPGEVCFAIFERWPTDFIIHERRPLAAMLNDVAAILDRYGKSIAPPS